MSSETPRLASPLTALLDVLDLTQLEENVYSGANVAMPGGRVFGGQVLAQGLLAADDTVPEGRFPHSTHGYFIRAGRVDEPITFAVEILSDSRSFSTRRTHAIQDGKPILSMICSFQEQQDGLDHQIPMPDAPDPETVRSTLDELGPIPDRLAQFWSNESPFDARHVDGSLFLGPSETARDTQQVWLRCRESVPDAGAKDRALHAALLAYACDQAMLEPVLRAHGESWATPGLRVASLDHAMWWHRPVRVDEWFLFSQSSPTAQSGRGLGSNSVFAPDGRLVATIMQEGMVRVP